MHHSRIKLERVYRAFLHPPYNSSCPLASLQAPIVTTVCLQNRVILASSACAQAGFVGGCSHSDPFNHLLPPLLPWTSHRSTHICMTTNLGFFILFWAFQTVRNPFSFPYSTTVWIPIISTAKHYFWILQ